MGIVKFLKARIAEDEAIARSVASDGQWISGSTYGMFVSVEARCGTVVSGEWERRDADHIARHDPARALRDITAKRALLASHDIGHDPCDAHDAMYESIPCDVILHLAAIYSDHPDFNEEWRS